MVCSLCGGDADIESASDLSIDGTEYRLCSGCASFVEHQLLDDDGHRSTDTRGRETATAESAQTDD
jgi:ribosome-binding protein aMBF1 (putative translation factor)